MLRKTTPLTFFEGQRGRAATPAQTVCDSVPPGPPPGGGSGGSWVVVCETPCVYIGSSGNGSIGLGGTPNDYLCGLPVCTTVWRQG